MKLQNILRVVEFMASNSRRIEANGSDLTCDMHDVNLMCDDGSWEEYTDFLAGESLKYTYGDGNWVTIHFEED